MSNSSEENIAAAAGVSGGTPHEKKTSVENTNKKTI
jgi:hypothetical protein